MTAALGSHSEALFHWEHRRRVEATAPDCCHLRERGVAAAGRGPRGDCRFVKIGHIIAVSGARARTHDAPGAAGARRSRAPLGRHDGGWQSGRTPALSSDSLKRAVLLKTEEGHFFPPPGGSICQKPMSPRCDQTWRGKPPARVVAVLLKGVFWMFPPP